MLFDMNKFFLGTDSELLNRFSTVFCIASIGWRVPSEMLIHEDVQMICCITHCIACHNCMK